MGIPENQDQTGSIEKWERSRFRKWLNDNSYIALSILTILFILLPPFVNESTFIRIFIIILYTLMIGTSLLIITESERLRPKHWLLMIILLLPWVKLEGSNLASVANLLLSGFFLFVAVMIVIQIFKSKEVNLNVMIGSVAGYLMLGIGFSFICPLLLLIDPAAYQVPDSFTPSYGFVYYSFVTMSTLGYGDITPHSQQAQSVALLITISGQFYMVLVVATLIGKFLHREV